MERKRDRKQQLIEIYLRKGSEQGFDRVSLAEIAKSAGISKASVFSHFESYAQLEKQAVSYCMAALSGSASTVDFSALDAESLFVNLINSYLDTFLSEPAVYLLSLVQQKELTAPEYTELSRKIDQMITARMRIALEYCVQRNWLDIFDTDSAAAILSAAVRRYLVKTLLPGSSPDAELDEFVTDLLRLFRR